MIRHGYSLSKKILRHTLCVSFFGFLALCTPVFGANKIKPSIFRTLFNPQSEIFKEIGPNLLIVEEARQRIHEAVYPDEGKYCLPTQTTLVIPDFVEKDPKWNNETQKYEAQHKRALEITPRFQVGFKTKGIDNDIKGLFVNGASLAANHLIDKKLTNYLQQTISETIALHLDEFQLELEKAQNIGLNNGLGKEVISSRKKKKKLKSGTQILVEWFKKKGVLDGASTVAGISHHLAESFFSKYSSPVGFKAKNRKSLWFGQFLHEEIIQNSTLDFHDPTPLSADMEFHVPITSPIAFTLQPHWARLAITSKTINNIFLSMLAAPFSSMHLGASTGKSSIFSNINLPWEETIGAVITQWFHSIFTEYYPNKNLDRFVVKNTMRIVQGLSYVFFILNHWKKISITKRMIDQQINSQLFKLSGYILANVEKFDKRELQKPSASKLKKLVTDGFNIDKEELKGKLSKKEYAPIKKAFGKGRWSPIISSCIFPTIRIIGLTCFYTFLWQEYKKSGFFYRLCK
ncbi:hypothetical protein KAU11_03920 [Candidatus Babeliales bacterium]|nr:hypothetical protein [Candidatus Babeliales bacterium]